MKKSRLEPLSKEQRQKFISLCPDFVVELRSPTDRLSVLKTREYLENGAQLGWLLDPEANRAYLYRPEGVEELEDPETLEGDPVLPGFALDLLEVG